mmetsp:Transcript_69175/g.196003  ORF Transcript_69175/g.196003 Transcript_69175/m.196003 type:complete len:204 (-) Transcript_69175:330-941(-)
MVSHRPSLASTTKGATLCSQMPVTSRTSGSAVTPYFFKQPSPNDLDMARPGTPVLGMKMRLTISPSSYLFWMTCAPARSRRANSSGSCALCSPVTNSAAEVERSPSTARVSPQCANQASGRSEWKQHAATVAPLKACALLKHRSRSSCASAKARPRASLIPMNDRCCERNSGITRDTRSETTSPCSPWPSDAMQTTQPQSRAV